MKRFFVGLVLLHALSWGEQAAYAQVLDMVNSKYTFGPIKGFTAVLSLLLAGLLVFTLYGVHPRTAKEAYAGAAVRLARRGEIGARSVLGIAPADAAPEALEAADYICKAPGGRGCLREGIEMILKSQGKWQFDEDKFHLIY